MTKQTYCGYVAIVGRPNVGKSTLLNKIIGQKISITSRKPQTTRHRILGIKTEKDRQTIYVDTPGLYNKGKKALYKYMRHEIDNALSEVDIIIFVIEALNWSEEDEIVLEKLAKQNLPIILAINKIDLTKDKQKLLPFIKEVSAKLNFKSIIPLSAKTADNIPDLEKAISKNSPPSPFYFYEDQVTDRNERFLVAEIVREKLTRLLGQELPHQLTVAIEKFAKVDRVIHIVATIYVEKEGQKKIIIGKKGAKLKEIATKARVDIERLLDSAVFLQVWVKVKPGWSGDQRSLRELGYQ